MQDFIIISIIAVVAVISVMLSFKHFKGEGGCCGGGSYKPKKNS